MPPASRNQRVPTTGDTPAPTAASWLACPAAIAAQNRRRSSRRATEGRPGERSGARPARSERRLRVVIITPLDGVLRRSVEFTQYACIEYTAALAQHGIQPSMSRVGSPYDNAKAERFMRTLKQEEVDGRRYRDADEARHSIGTFIEEIYNRQRLHSALAYLTPAEFEATLPPQRPSAADEAVAAAALGGA